MSLSVYKENICFHIRIYAETADETSALPCEHIMLLLHGAFKLKQRAFVTLMHSALTTTRTQGMQTIFKCKTFVLF